MKYKVLKDYIHPKTHQLIKAGAKFEFSTKKEKLYMKALEEHGFIKKIEEVILLPQDIHHMLQTWIFCNDNPIEKISILDEHNKKDEDGLYNYHFYGYVNREKSNNLIAISLEVRLKTPLDGLICSCVKDYKLEELGLRRRNEIL